jgi:hypothetical protein
MIFFHLSFILSGHLGEVVYAINIGWNKTNLDLSDGHNVYFSTQCAAFIAKSPVFNQLFLFRRLYIREIGPNYDTLFTQIA